MKEILADIITIGDEILYGQTVDTNSAFMGKTLGEVGIKINQTISISDNRQHILDTLSNSKAQIILITGGLGPTLDDITKQTLCDFFDDKLELNELAWKGLTEFYDSRKRKISAINKLQAHLPTKCECLPNTIGTASGMLFKQNNKVYISMPGVPREMKQLITNEAIPRLKSIYDLPFIKHQFINTVGIPESDLATKMEGWVKNIPNEISLAYLPSLGSVKLRLTIKGENEKYLNNVLELATQKLLPIIKEYIYSTDESTLTESISQLLKDKKITVSTAESCTGGNVAKTLISVPGSSNYFNGGIITYSNEMKIQELDVKPGTIEKYGAVSEQTAIEMVKGASKKFNSDISIATTGIAGPDGGTPEKPIGTVWIALFYNGNIITKLIQIGNLGRVNNIENTTIAALNLIRKVLK